MMSTDYLWIAQSYQASLELARLPELVYHYNPRQLVAQIDKVKLYHYAARTGVQTVSTPLLVVFATVNRPEILDLFPDRSFIGHLLSAGIDVYLLDWGYPDEKDKSIAVSDYVNKYLHFCIRHIRKSCGYDKINLLGICQGGLFSLCYSALNDDLKNLILISAPVNFHTRENIVGQLLQKINVDVIMDIFGRMPGWWLTQFFISLRPFELIGQKYLRFVDDIQQAKSTDAFLQVEKWLYDAPDQTVTSFTQLVKDFYLENNLIKNNIYLSEQRVQLAHVNLPVLNIIASQDEIVPPSASRDLDQYILSEDYSEAYFASGHIGIYISEKIGNKLTNTIANWLQKRDD